MSREWRFFLRDAIRFCERICEYVRGLSRHEFESDSRTLDATLRNLELLGEALSHIPDEIRSQNSQIPWQKIIGIRIILAHVYFRLEMDIIWDAVANHVPAVLAELREIDGRLGEH